MQHSEDPLSIARRFAIEERPCSAEPYGSGHINDTFRIETEAGKRPAYLLQWINHHVFRDPPSLMANMRRVSEHLKARIRDAGGDPAREAVTVVPAADGRDYCRDKAGGYWRLLTFVAGTHSYDQVENPVVARETGRGFGRFQNLLSDFDSTSLVETIPRFHDMEWRLQNLDAAWSEDSAGRRGELGREMDFVNRRREDMVRLFRMAKTGELPIRVTHNDTKVNNILFDAHQRALCVIDLDTVMPGVVHYDFGDAVRTATNTAAEDEPQVDRVTSDPRLFHAFAEGFLSELAPRLTQSEVETLVLAPPYMTFIMGVRFLTDFLEGDVYYKIHRPSQNIDRARAQFRLVESMESQQASRDAAIRRLCGVRE
jgi:Ser/Thr protein kinase RdoA (MazF antagonist)